MAEESKAALVWLERFQGMSGGEELFGQALATAERLSGVVATAAERLPFGAEPPDFPRALDALAPKEAGR
jgi:hypothetical protein